MFKKANMKIYITSRNRKTSEQIKREKEIERLIHLDIFAPIDESLLQEFEEQETNHSNSTTKKKIVLPTPSFRDIGNGDNYDPLITKRFSNAFQSSLITCENWIPPELRNLNPKKRFNFHRKKKNIRSLGKKVKLKVVSQQFS